MGWFGGEKAPASVPEADNNNNKLSAEDQQLADQVMEDETVAAGVQEGDPKPLDEELKEAA